MPQQVNVYRELKMFPGAIVTGALGPLFDTGGTTYYVNNITGSATADGLSWNSACDQVDTAVTLSEASRLIHPGTTTNDYIRNKIVVQGTGTAYEGIVTLPSYCDLIGLGANPYGNGAGIARVGADSYLTASGGGMTGASDSTGDVRGVYIYNIQWQSNGAADCFQVRNIFRSTIEECAFFTAGLPNSTPVAGIDITGVAGGVVIRDCHWGGNASRTDRIRTGINLASHFKMSLIERCQINGSTSGITVAAAALCEGSVIRDCIIGELGQGTCTTGITDAATVGTMVYVNCYINASDPIAVTHDASRFVLCSANTGYVQT